MSSLTCRQGICNSIKRTISVEDGLFQKHILFGKFLLDIFGEENPRMQEKISIYTDLWERINCFKSKLSKCLASFENNDFSMIGVVSLSQTEKEAYVAAIKVAMKNLQMRFPCPSRSLNKRQFGKTTNSLDAVAEARIFATAYSSCHLRTLNDVLCSRRSF